MMGLFALFFVEFGNFVVTALNNLEFRDSIAKSKPFVIFEN